MLLGDHYEKQSLAVTCECLIVCLQAERYKGEQLNNRGEELLESKSTMQLYYCSLLISLQTGTRW